MVDKLVEIADLVIPPNDISVSGFVYNKITSWYEGSTGQASNELRDIGDGWFDDEDINYAGLVVSFEGVCVDTDKVQLARKKARFAALRRNGSNIVVAVTDPSGRTWRSGKVIKVGIPHSKYLDSFTWSIDISCADPYRYSPTVSAQTGVPVSGGGLTWPATWPITYLSGGSDGRISLTNSGSAPSWPRFRVAGGLSQGVRITKVGAGNGQLVLSRQILDNDVVGFDADSQRVWLNDPANDLSGYLTVDNWWSVAPGETMVAQFEPLGDQSSTPSLSGQLDPADY